MSYKEYDSLARWLEYEVQPKSCRIQAIVAETAFENNEGGITKVEVLECGHWVDPNTINSWFSYAGAAKPQGRRCVKCEQLRLLNTPLGAVAIQYFFNNKITPWKE